MTHFPKQEFFLENLLMSLVSFIYAYLNAISSYVWQPNFLRKIPNKNFQFTKIPEKTNDMIFLISPNIYHVFGSILTIFGHFCPMGIFLKKFGCHITRYIWVPNTTLSFRKNQWANSEKTYGQTGWMDRQTEGWSALFYRTLPPEPEVQ